MKELQVFYTSVNEDGVVYDYHPDLDSALNMLRAFPNDCVIVTLGEPYRGVEDGHK